MTTCANHTVCLHRAGNYAVNAIRPDLAFPPDPPEEN